MRIVLGSLVFNNLLGFQQLESRLKRAGRRESTGMFQLNLLAGTILRCLRASIYEKDGSIADPLIDGDQNKIKANPSG